MLENDSDFVIERKTSTTDKMLVCILSQGLLYLKNVKTGELQNNLRADEVLKFLNDCPISSYPKTVKYPLKNGCTHLSEYLLWAMKNLNVAKDLVNSKIFITLNHYSFRDQFKNITPEQLKDLKWCVKFVEGFEHITKEWDYEDYLFHTYNWLHAMESLNCSRDKIMYNKDNMIELDFDYFKYYDSAHHTLLTDILKLGNLDFNNFIVYIKKISREEFLFHHESGYNRSSSFSISEYYDYLNMQNQMYGKIKEKYPNNWLTSLQIMKGKFNAWKQLHADERFLNNMDKIKELEYNDDKYCIIVPSKASEVVDEGAHLGHCVASYVDRIIEGETNILFMRKVDSKEESLVTIEYKNNEVCQYKGYGDRPVTEEENQFIEKWCKVKNLEKTERG